MQLLQVCQNIADVLEAERVQARRITTLYAGGLIWAEKDSALGDSNAAARLLQPGWRRVFLPDGMGGLREGYMRSRFLELCQGQERWRKWATQRPTVLTERIDAVSQSESKEQEDADALRSEEAFRESIVQTAYSYLGTQYRWGGKTACGIDCSGLAFMSYFRNGILIWRDAAIKEGYPVHEIPIEQAKPGDLLFFPGHVAIYLGNGKIIHATGHPESSCVTVNSLWEGESGYREDLKNSLRQQMQLQAIQQAEDAYNRALVQQAVKNSEVDIPKEMIEQRIDEIVQEVRLNLDAQDMNFDDYLKNIGKTGKHQTGGVTPSGQ